MRAATAVLGVALATLLLGCPKDRLWTLRVHEPGKVVAGARVLGKVRVDARVTLTCPGGDHGPAPLFEPTKDGTALRAKTFHSVKNDCTFTIALPGGGLATFPVGDLCTEPVGKDECEGVAVTLVVGDAPPSVPTAGGAIPLDAPRPAGSSSREIQTVLAVTLYVDGEMRADDAKVDDAGLVAAATKAKAADPEIRAVIKADAAVPHGRVIHALDLLKQAGVARIAFGVAPVVR